MRTTASKFIAALLLLLFVEKAGLRLFIHDYFHTTVSASGKDENTGRDHFSKLGCDCIEDFFLPVTYTEEFSVELPGRGGLMLLSVPHTERFISASSFSILLRGPPRC
jgi:hypothetical protein